jgi:hypothetical protein
VPSYDDHYLFKMLVLEGMQAGLSWLTILSKMETLCQAYDDFVPQVVAEYDEAKWEALLADPGVVRNRLKIKAVTTNAQAYLAVSKEFGSFSNYIWSFVQGQPLINHWTSIDQVPAKSDLSDKLSKDLQKRGFKFVGSTTVYAFMQAVGIVNDHLESCDFK